MNEKIARVAGIFIVFTIVICGAVFFLMATAEQTVFSKVSIWAEGVAIISATIVFASTAVYLLKPEDHSKNAKTDRITRLKKIVTVLLCSSFFSFLTWGFVRMLLS